MYNRRSFRLLWIKPRDSNPLAAMPYANDFQVRWWARQNSNQGQGIMRNPLPSNSGGITEDSYAVFRGASRPANPTELIPCLRPNFGRVPRWKSEHAHRVPVRTDRTEHTEVGGAGMGGDFMYQSEISRASRAISAFACYPQRLGLLAELANP